MATASEVPGRYDVVINGQGYVFDRTRESTLYGSRARAEYGYTQTFLERTNITGDYGDNQQDFWLTASMRDWSLGEGGRYWRGSDPDKSRQYYRSYAVDTSTPGQITVQPKVIAISAAANVKASCPAGSFNQNGHAYVTATKLYTVDSAGAVTDQGNHGAGTPNFWGLTTDGPNLYIAGATTIRRWNGSAFSDFGAANANAGALAFLNNTLYSCDGSVLKSYDGSGVATTLYTWKDATNTALTALSRKPKLIPFGGQLLIFWPYIADAPELWTFNGVGVSRTAEFPASMIGHDIVEMEGIIFVSGLVTSSQQDGGAPGASPTVWYYANGSIGKLWQSRLTFSGVQPQAGHKYQPALGVYADKLVFASLMDGKFMSWTPDTGAIMSLGALNSSTPSSVDFPQLSSTGGSVLYTGDTGSGTLGSFYPDLSNWATTGILESGLVDFETSLTKIIRSIRVIWEGGGSVDIAYQVDTLGGAYTTLQTGAVSGTEYILPTVVTGTAVGVQLTLNNSGGSRPTIKRVLVRTAPLLTSFKVRTYNLDLTNVPNNKTLLQDGSVHSLTGHEQAANLISAITSSTAVTITDRFGTYTAILEPGQSSILELHSESGGGLPANSGQFVATITAREI